MESKPTVLITRLSAIGDCVMTLPVANAIRDQLPGARVLWLIQGAGQKLLSGHPSVDEFIVVPRGWLKSPRGAYKLRRALRDRDITWTLDPQSLTKSATAAWLSGAVNRVGFQAPEGREIAPWLNNRLVQRTADHAVDAYLQLLEPMGISSVDVRFDLPVDVAAAEACRRFLLKHRLSDYVVINPGASWPSKMWPAERFAEVVSYMGQRMHVPSVVVWSGPEERRLAEEIVEQSQGHAMVAPDTNLKELTELLRGARLMVSADTGPLHIAAAAGTPCVGLYGPTRPSHCGPYGARHIVLQTYYQAGTSRERRGAANDAMRAISFTQVSRACQHMLRALERRVA